MGSTFKEKNLLPLKAFSLLKGLSSAAKGGRKGHQVVSFETVCIQFNYKQNNKKIVRIKSRIFSQYNKQLTLHISLSIVPGDLF